MSKKKWGSADCRLNKRTYPDKKAAEVVRTQQSLIKQRSLRVYYCHNCQGYHLTKRGGKPAEKPIIHLDLLSGKIIEEEKE
jgi:hypothetical protein